MKISKLTRKYKYHNKYHTLIKTSKWIREDREMYAAIKNYMTRRYGSRWDFTTSIYGTMNPVWFWDDKKGYIYFRDESDLTMALLTVGSKR
jgi:hypothetical protein